MEIQTRTKRHHPRVDLTAMVDLGFLLITFFMLATTLGETRVMELIAPAGESPAPVTESKSMVLMLGTRDKIYHYKLMEARDATMHIDSFSYAPYDLRARIIQRQNEVQAMYGDKQQLFVLIKPLPGSSYKQLIDVLDEMTILQVNRYAIVKAESEEDRMVMQLAGEKG
jgi:biopolymer transport protein ExbD